MSPTGAGVHYREATAADVPAIVRSRGADPEWGPADPRTASYMKGMHHPNRALMPRVVFVALEGENVTGYIGGHLTRRYDCDGELQYLWVGREYRRRGVASGLFGLLAQWFRAQEASRICVDVLPDNLAARSFYTRHGATELNAHWLVWPDIESSRDAGP